MIVTDKEKGLKNALAQAFPRAQQQLCVWHINANVRAKIRSRWRDNTQGRDDTAQDLVLDASQDELVSSPEEVAIPTDDDFNVAARRELPTQGANEAAAAQSEGAAAQGDDYSRDAMFAA